jgi:hypothetical protein
VEKIAPIKQKPNLANDADPHHEMQNRLIKCTALLVETHFVNDLMHRACKEKRYKKGQNFYVKPVK